MSRASLLTGSYNTRISVPSVIQPWEKIGLNPEETNIANLLKKNGYTTACFGKWHLGHLPEFLPLNQGFDEYFGIPYSNNMISGYGPKKDGPPLPLYDGEKVIETDPDQTQFTKRFTERTVEFIEKNKDQPFFVYLPHPMIHTPLFASENFKGKSEMGILGDAIEELDWSVGRIMETLDKLNLADNTLLIFTSDNGPAEHSATPLRGEKGSTFEGGVRVPTIMRWPGKIPAGTTCGQIMGTIDMLPTIAAITGSELPADRPIDGENSSALLFDETPKQVRDTHLYVGWGPGKVDAIRQSEWKLFLGPADKREQAKKPKGKGAKFVGALYNLSDDPSEKHDLAAEHPEIVSRLTKEAKQRAAAIEAQKRPIGKAAIDSE